MYSGLVSALVPALSHLCIHVNIHGLCLYRTHMESNTAPFVRLSHIPLVSPDINLVGPNQL